jgi:hypothetical protein
MSDELICQNCHFKERCAENIKEYRFFIKLAIEKLVHSVQDNRNYNREKQRLNNLICNPTKCDITLTRQIAIKNKEIQALKVENEKFRKVVEDIFNTPIECGGDCINCMVPVDCEPVTHTGLLGKFQDIAKQALKEVGK